MNRSTTVDQSYSNLWQQKGALERVVRTTALYASMHNMLQHQVRKQMPQARPLEVKLLVAEKLYLTDPGAQKLIALLRQRHAG